MIQYFAQYSIELDNVHQQINILCSVLLLHANVHIIVQMELVSQSRQQTGGRRGEAEKLIFLEVKL